MCYHWGLDVPPNRPVEAGGWWSYLVPAPPWFGREDGSRWYAACCGRCSIDTQAYRSGSPTQTEDRPLAERAEVPESNSRGWGQVPLVVEQIDVEE